LGNFSISHYTALRVEPTASSITYVIDMAEIRHSRNCTAKVSFLILATHWWRLTSAPRSRPWAGLQLEVNGAG
jgi:hypothetical protein